MQGPAVHSLPLPFPVRNASDLKRAVRHIVRHDPGNSAARRYVVARARALGHLDLVPTQWTSMTPTKLASTSLDRQFEELAEKHDISAARLKAVYFRGVEEYMSSDMTFGSATMYGLARVQRFINDQTLDSDLCEIHDYSEARGGIDLSEEALEFIINVLYSSGEAVVDQFRPGQVTAITVLEDGLVVDGVLGDQTWSYTLNTSSGDDNFVVR